MLKASNGCSVPQEIVINLLHHYTYQYIRYAPVFVYHSGTYHFLAHLCARMAVSIQPSYVFSMLKLFDWQHFI